MSKLVDLTGRRFGRLLVIGIYDRGKGGSIRWKCQCDCGNIIPVFKNTLLKDNGTIKSCGCVYADELRKEIGKRKDHLEIVGVKQYGRKCRVVVKCDCGTVREMTLSQFNNPDKHSCGCVGVLKGIESPYYKHGMSRTRIYIIYRDMYNRCYNKEDISYPNYGAKGIKIFDEWLGEMGAKNFADWAYANGYNKNAKRGECTIDRIEPSGDYCPENCRWADYQTQANNKGNNRYFEIDGVTKTLSEWCREYGGLCPQSVWGRVKNGMDIKTALTKPMQKKKANMTQQEIKERKQHRLESDRKWRAEHKQQVQASRDKWKRNNPEKDRESKRKYEEKKKLERLQNKEIQ